MSQKRNATRMRWHKRHERNLRQLENGLLSSWNGVFRMIYEECDKCGE